MLDFEETGFEIHDHDTENFGEIENQEVEEPQCGDENQDDVREPDVISKEIDMNSIKDGIDPNRATYSELDTDNSGVVDVVKVKIDTDGDGEEDRIERYFDYDQDGKADIVKIYTDVDNDGDYDTLEKHFDSDGDGLLDTTEVYVDEDGDRKMDYSEMYAFDPSSNKLIISDDYNFDDDDDDYDNNADKDTDPDDDYHSGDYYDPDDDDDKTFVGQYDPSTVTDPSLVIGHPEVSIGLWEYQGDTGRCALYTQLFVINELTGQNIDIEDFAKIATENGWFNESTGTMPLNSNMMLDYFGIDNEMYFNKSMDDIIDCLNNGGKVIASVDAWQIWDRESTDIFTPDGVSNHSVEVIGIDNSDPNNPMVILNDSGTLDGRGELVPLEVFENAWNEGDRKMIVCYPS